MSAPLAAKWPMRVVVRAASVCGIAPALNASKTLVQLGRLVAR